MKKINKLLFIPIALLCIINQKISPITYKYKTAICPSSEPCFELPEKVNCFAKKINASLNHSIFFDVSFLIKSKYVKNYLLKSKFYKPDVGKTIFIKTVDGNNVECMYFNRNSNKLIIIGGGFTNEKELMAPFIHIFPDYDIILFDYRGHGINSGKYYKPKTWRLNPIHKIFNINTKKTKLGAEEEKDVTAIVKYFRNIKNYQQVYGLGICYSALIFIKAQSIQQQKNIKLFDKIILDGCWLSLRDFITKLSKDLKLLCSPQYGGWKENWLNKQEWFQKSIIWLTEKIFKIDFDKISILPFLKNINIPILYFYGKNDLVINKKEFETIWNNLNTEKTAIITSNPHVRNHIKEKEFYKLACNLFFDLPQNKFISSLKNKAILKQYYLNKINYI